MQEKVSNRELVHCGHVVGPRPHDRVVVAAGSAHVLIDRSYADYPGESMLTPDQARRLAAALVEAAAIAEKQEDVGFR